MVESLVGPDLSRPDRHARRLVTHAYIGELRSYGAWVRARENPVSWGNTSSYRGGLEFVKRPFSERQIGPKDM